VTPSPLSELPDGNFDELSIAPIYGVKACDADCDATEAWILAGPSLTADTIGVEVIEARYHGPGTVDDPYWVVVDGADCLNVAEAASLVAYFGDQNYGYIGERD
jgi:hypothetical protein